MAGKGKFLVLCSDGNGKKAAALKSRVEAHIFPAIILELMQRKKTNVTAIMHSLIRDEVESNLSAVGIQRRN